MSRSSAPGPGGGSFRAESTRLAGTECARIRPLSECPHPTALGQKERLCVEAAPVCVMSEDVARPGDSHHSPSALSFRLCLPHSCLCHKETSFPREWPAPKDSLPKGHQRSQFYDPITPSNKENACGPWAPKSFQPGAGRTVPFQRGKQD